MEHLDEALADLRLQEAPNISQTATKYGIDRSTLSRHWTGASKKKDIAYDNHRLLTTTQSKGLIQYINDLTERGLPPTTAMVRNFVATITGRQPGPNWVSRWLKAHSKELKSGYLTPIDSQRKKADSAFYYSLYFELMARKIAQYNVQPQNMYNMDEKGFLIGFLQKARRVFSKAAFEAGRIKHISQDGNREWITLLATIYVDGTMLSPGLIYQAISRNIQDS